MSSLIYHSLSLSKIPLRIKYAILIRRYITKRLKVVTLPIKSPNHTNTISDTYSTNTVNPSAIRSLKYPTNNLIPKKRQAIAPKDSRPLTISHISPRFTINLTALDTQKNNDLNVDIKSVLKRTERAAVAIVAPKPYRIANVKATAYRAVL